MYVNISICLDEPLDLLIDYFKKFGHKPCCFDDTHVFITKLLSTADADKVSMASLTVCEFDATSFFQLCALLEYLSNIFLEGEDYSFYLSCYHVSQPNNACGYFLL